MVNTFTSVAWAIATVKLYSMGWIFQGWIRIKTLCRWIFFQLTYWKISWSSNPVRPNFQQTLRVGWLTLSPKIFLRKNKSVFQRRSVISPTWLSTTVLGLSREAVRISLGLIRETGSYR